VGGFSHRSAGAVTLEAHAVGNVFTLVVPRAGARADGDGRVITWRAADGHVIKTFR
jgi:hypothetical protein